MNPQPYPSNPLTNCPSCKKATLIGPRLCQGGGKYPRNAGRWYTVCSNKECKHFVWYGLPTPLHEVPAAILDQNARRRAATTTNDSIFCTQPDCMTAGSIPRKANKLCERQLCAHCCKALGGCRLHKSTDMALTKALATINMSPLIPTVSPVAGPSSEATASTSITSATGTVPVGTRTSYAKPLDPNYGHPELIPEVLEKWVKVHLDRERKLENLERERAVMEKVSKLQTVKVWAESLRKPKVLRVSLPTEGFLVPEEHPALLLLLGQDCQYIDVFTLHNDLSSDWTTYPLNVPIPAVEGLPILVIKGGVEVEQCVGVDDEIAVFIDISQPIFYSRTVSKGKSKEKGPSQSPNYSRQDVPPFSSPSKLTSDLDMTRQPSSSSSPIMPRAIAPIPFPVVFACDMIKGIRDMLLLKNPTLARIEEEFKVQFPGCFFKRKTFYKHRRYYLKAKEANILSHFSSLGRTEDGRWTKLVRAINDLSVSGANLTSLSGEVIDLSDRDSEVSESDIKKTATPEVSSVPPFSRANNLHSSSRPNTTMSTTPSATPAIAVSQPTTTTTSSDTSVDKPLHESDDELEYEAPEIRIDYYRMHDNQLVTWTGTFDTRPAIVQIDPAQRGSVKNIYRMMACLDVGEDAVDCVLKKVSLAGEWWKPGPNEDIGYLVEGMRLARAYFLMGQFHVVAQQKNVAIYPISFVPTYLVSNASAFAIGIAQPATSGTVFSRESLMQQSLDLAVETLNAFSHFMFEETERRIVMVDFQGHILRDDTLSIFDGTSHTRTLAVEFETIEKYSLGNQWDQGIMAFIADHHCNSLCHNMQLGSLAAEM